jgi:hypothetical protein
MPGKMEKMKAVMKTKNQQLQQQQQHQNNHLHQHLQLKKKVLRMKANIPKIILKMRNNQKINNIAIGTVDHSSELYFLLRVISILA